MRLFRLPPSAYLFGLNGSVAAVQMVSSILLARVLGVEGRGIFASWVILGSAAGGAALFGLHLYAGRAAAQEPKAVKDIYKRVFSTALYPISIAWLLLFVLFMVKDLDGGLTSWALACAFVAFSVFNAIQVQVEISRNSLKTYALARGSFAIFNLIGIASVYVLFASTPLNYFWALVLTAASGAAITYWAIGETIRDVTTKWSSTKTPFASLLDAKKDGMATLMVALATIADRLFVTLLFSAVNLGNYVVAMSIAQLQSLFSEAMAPLFFARMSALKEDDKLDKDWLAMRIRQSTIVNVVSGLLTFCASFFAIPILFGPEFNGAIGLACFLIPAFALKAIMRPFEEALKGLNKSLQQSFGLIIWFSAFVILCIPALIFDNVYYIAAAMVGAGLIGVLTMASLLKKLIQIRLTDMLVPRKSDFNGLIREITRKGA